MRILYIARHTQTNSADDEGAITHALRELGHEVICYQEQRADRCTRLRPDLVLFHKFSDSHVLRCFEGHCPRAFWYFDLVDWPNDPTLAPRCTQRRNWMRQILPHVEYGFCTDGDWVRTVRGNPELIGDVGSKLYWLPQGADERIAGLGKTSGWSNDKPPSILFTGIAKGGGTGRERFVSALAERYGPVFQHIPGGLYRERLRDVVARSDIVVCPDSPVTDYYWSNRVYNAAGFGGFILHPYCANLITHFHANKELVYYHSRSDLVTSIDYFLKKPETRRDVSDRALARVLQDHLYRHRVLELLAVVKGKV